MSYSSRSERSIEMTIRRSKPHPGILRPVLADRVGPLEAGPGQPPAYQTGEHATPATMSIPDATGDARPQSHLFVQSMAFWLIRIDPSVSPASSSSIAFVFMALHSARQPAVLSPTPLAAAAARPPPFAAGDTGLASSLFRIDSVDFPASRIHCLIVHLHAFGQTPGGPTRVHRRAEFHEFLGSVPASTGKMNAC